MVTILLSSVQTEHGEQARLEVFNPMVAAGGHEKFLASWLLLTWVMKFVFACLFYTMMPDRNGHELRLVWYFYLFHEYVFGSEIISVSYLPDNDSCKRHLGFRSKFTVLLPLLNLWAKWNEILSTNHEILQTLLEKVKLKQK